MIEGKPTPTELRNEEPALRKEIELEDEDTAGSKVDVFFLMFQFECSLFFMNKMCKCVNLDSTDKIYIWNFCR